MAGSDTTITERALAGAGTRPPTLRAIVLAHKRMSAAVVVVVVMLAAFTVAAAFSSPTTAMLSDATSCSQWHAASAAQRSAYAQFYFRQHGPVRGVASNPASLSAAIAVDCANAAYMGEADDVTVFAALRHAY
jgi:hypothetical protein